MRIAILSVKSFLAACLLLTGSTIVRGQKAEVAFHVGGNVCQGKYQGQKVWGQLNPQGALKVGLVFPSRWGIGLFGEMAKFSFDIRKVDYSNGPTFYTNGPDVVIADPQTTVGIELYKKSFVSERAYLRFGALLGYSFLANTHIPRRGKQKSGIGTGLDVSFLFPVAQRLSGVVNTGFRYHSSKFGTDKYVYATIEAFSIPFTIGLHYNFARSDRKAGNKQEKEEE